MKIADKAWLAGIIDGEGCIGIYKKNIARSRNPSYCLQMVVTMTCRRTVKRILDLSQTGSFKRAPAKRCGLPNAKPIYTWQCSANSALSLLKQICPYIYTKKKHVELAIRFQTRVNKAPRTYAGRPLSDYERQVRENMFLKSRRLNERGVS